MRWTALANGSSGGRLEALRCREMVQPGDDRSDLGGARELVTVIGDRLPEGDHVAVGDDWLDDVNCPHRRVVLGLQPAGDGDRPAGRNDVGARPGDTDDDGSL